jgi:hypothetical protein
MRVVHPASQEATFAHETRHEWRRRAMVDVEAAIELFQFSGMHHADPIGEGKGFVLVVRHQHRREAKALEQVAQFLAQAGTQACVEAGKGFVQEKQVRARCERRESSLDMATKSQLTRFQKASTYFGRADCGSRCSRRAPTHRRSAAGCHRRSAGWRHCWCWPAPASRPAAAPASPSRSRRSDRGLGEVFLELAKLPKAASIAVCQLAGRARRRRWASGSSSRSCGSTPARHC